MANEIILYNLRDDVKEEDYVRWCEYYKGPLLLALPGSKSFTLSKMTGGVKGDGQKGSPPGQTRPPFSYIGILDLASFEEWAEAKDSEAFKEFLSQWLSKWVADFYILGGVELYHGENG
jgi:hypothetical protein